MTYITPKRVILVVALTATWCGLWRDISIANVLAGIAIGIVSLLPDLRTSGMGNVRIKPLAHFFWLVLIDLLKSTISVASEIITPNDGTEESIIEVKLPVQARNHALLLVVAITLTPGTAVVETDPATGSLFLHLLHNSQRESTIAHVKQLAELACQALPAPTQGANA